VIRHDRIDHVPELGEGDVLVGFIGLQRCGSNVEEAARLGIVVADISHVHVHG